MAVTLDTETSSGIAVDGAYWRLNSFDQLPNRQPDGSYGVPAIARFRAFASADAFHNGKGFLDGCERTVPFTPTALDGNLVEEAYAALKALPEFAAATDV